MIYELRSYVVKPGCIDQFDAEFARRYARRERYARLGGIWKTVFEGADEVHHLWPYESYEARLAARRAVDIDPWFIEERKKSDLRLLLAQQRSSLLEALPGTVPLHEQHHGSGNVYELIIEAYPPGHMHHVVAAWASAYGRRAALSPMVGCWSAEIGELNRLVQIWVYRNEQHRDETHRLAQELPDWPPRTEPLRTSFSQRVMKPLQASPLQ